MKEVNDSCVIVIPVHKEDPSEEELLSFVQCFSILYSHPIRVLAPVGLNLKAYQQRIQKFEIIFIETYWLCSVEQYNNLKRDIYFYNLFREYQYLLTYELDAWVFRDEISIWCKKEFDYIGAPWFKGFSRGNSDEFAGVGNSGFSLRKISSCIKILEVIRKLQKVRNFWFKSKLQSIIKFERLMNLSKSVYRMKNTEQLTIVLLASTYRLNEDYFWGYFINAIFLDFKVATVEEAIKFSFEVKPDMLFQMNDGKLPFGCHAWGRYNPSFWLPYIKNA